MNCNEAAEFVSALCDGERIPSDAAAHVGDCVNCQTRMEEYISIGVEMRRVACLEAGKVLKPIEWEPKQESISTMWQKGWETMRIPRFAFAALVMGIVALGSSLAIVKVRARSEANVVILKIPFAKGGSGSCPVSTGDMKARGCGFEEQVASGQLAYRINYLAKDGDRIKIAVRAKVFSGAGNQGRDADLTKEPGKEYWFVPGETLKVDVPGRVPLEISGNWMDHMPVMFEEAEHHDLDPGTDELRVLAPILLKGKSVEAEFEGGADSKGEVALYFPGNGLYEISLLPKQGATEGSVRLNRIDFEVGGKSYAFVTGSPVTRNQKVWVLYTAKFKPLRFPADQAQMGASDQLTNPLN